MIVKIQRRETPFALVNKSILEDKRLSWKAKGIMAYLLSLSRDSIPTGSFFSRMAGSDDRLRIV